MPCLCGGVRDAHSTDPSADNNAVGYFQKQGFTKELTLHRERWAGLIKDYDGGTLMECVLHPKLPYTRLTLLLRVSRRPAIPAPSLPLSSSPATRNNSYGMLLLPAGPW